MRFKVANYSRLEIRLDTLHIYNNVDDWLHSYFYKELLAYLYKVGVHFYHTPLHHKP